MEHHMQKNSNFDMIFSEIVCIKGESKQCSSYSKHATTSAGPVASCPRKSPPAVPGNHPPSLPQGTPLTTLSALYPNRMPSPGIE